METKTIEGYLEKILYQNESNGYTVIELETDDNISTCTGNFVGVSEGDYVVVTGSVTNHAVYGPQLRMETFYVKRPTNVEAVTRYLSSGAIKGIGPAMAKKIVNEFGKDTFRIIEEEPYKLASIKGISEKMALDFGKQIREKKDVREAMIFLQKYGISMTLGLKIYDKYKNDIYGIIENNPYRLADEVSGIGFKTADDIARNVGITLDSEYRIESAIVYALQLEASSGNVYLPLDILTEKVLDILEVETINELDIYYSNLVIEGRVIIKDEDGSKKAYLPMLYQLERKIANYLTILDMKYELDDAYVDMQIQKIETEEEIELDEFQRFAVVESIRNGITVITGGPGTGKTTTINAIIKYFENEGLDVALCAPTGRAAKRMSEATKREAKTIHRLLEVNGQTGDESGVIFNKDEDNTIEADIIVVDEMSMVDIYLMKQLLCAVSEGTRVILVGDVNQLPSVGPGNVLKDIIDSNCFSVVKLNRIFRQSEDSDIVINAHKINEGIKIDLSVPSKDFFLVKRPVDGIFSAMSTLIKDKLPNYIGVSPFDIQVLTPTRVGTYGCVKLNEQLQNILNPPERKKREKIFGDYTFREGDKVMQVKNNYQIEWEVRGTRGYFFEEGIGVFNGDVGMIEEINNFSNEILVSFDYEDGKRKYVTYTEENLSELELAYAVTIHKSQGSEYPAIIIPLASGPKRLMNRNLIYTAVTRAKNCVCLLGMADFFYDMVNNEKDIERYSTLKQRICEEKGYDT